MVGRLQGTTRRRSCVVANESRSSKIKPALVRGSPSPRPPNFRRAPPSPGTRPRRRSPSPMPDSSSESEEKCDSEDRNSRETMVTTSSEVEKLESEGNRPQRPCVMILSPILEGEKPSPDVRSAAKVSEAPIGLSVGVDGDSEGVLTSRQWPNLVPSEVGLTLGEVSMEACCDSSPPWTASMADEAGASLPGELVVNGEGALDSLAGGCEECSMVVPMAAGSGLRKMMGEQLSQDVVGVIADCGGQSLMVCGSSQPPVASVSSCNPPNVTDFIAAALVRGGEVIEDLQFVGSLGVARSIAAEPTGVSLLPLSCGIVGMGDGGLVREEARVSPVVREALRSRPCDGLRQPPSSPVVLVSGAEGGVGKGGSHGCRSYAHIVQVDRRADVELSYIPPADGGNTIFMEESDGDRS
ncbi:hypothetical protein Dimus_015541 [Dionaea muscipula]